MIDATAFKGTGIYLITCITTGKVYVGESLSVSRRIVDHLSKLRCNRHENEYLQRAWVKHKEENFTFELLESVEPENRKQREGYYITLYDSTNRAKGFNIAIVNDRGFTTHNESSNEKNRLAHLNKPCSEKAKMLISQRMKGVPKTPEHVANSSRARTGLKKSAEAIARHAEAISKTLYSLRNQNTGEIFTGYNLRAFAESKGISSYSNLYEVARGKRKSCMGWEQLTTGLN